jgi:hypothetical protein
VCNSSGLWLSAWLELPVMRSDDAMALVGLSKDIAQYCLWLSVKTYLTGCDDDRHVDTRNTA